MDKKLKSLGKFTLDHNQVTLSDPCYDLEGRYIISPVRTGDWRGFVVKKDFGDAGKRCMELHAYNETFVNGNHLPKDLEWEKGTFSISVDTGQAGIFSTKVFRNEDVLDKKPEFDTGDPWYDMCCDVTLSEMHAGVVKGGVVSSAGWGDGGYEYEISKDNYGNIVGIKITFIGEE